MSASNTGQSLTTSKSKSGKATWPKHIADKVAAAIEEGETFQVIKPSLDHAWNELQDFDDKEEGNDEDENALEDNTAGANDDIGNSDEPQHINQVFACSPVSPQSLHENASFTVFNSKSPSMLEFGPLVITIGNKMTHLHIKPMQLKSVNRTYPEVMHKNWPSWIPPAVTALEGCVEPV